MIKPHTKDEIYGITTIGEKGQLVIPAKAREAMGLKKGSQLMVFSMGHEMVALAKLSDMAMLASHLSKKLKMIC